MLRWFWVYIGCIVAANLLHVTFGFVPIGFGLTASAGVYGAGLAFTARDMLQETLGRQATVVAILIGAVLSAMLSPALGVASGVAFLIAESLDFAVYTPLRERRWLTAVVLSNTVGAAADSALFLWLAFGSVDLWVGQTVGKLWMTALVIPLVWYLRRRRRTSSR